MVLIEEEQLRRFAGGDARRRARLRDMSSWFSTRAEMHADAWAIHDILAKAEEEAVFG